MKVADFVKLDNGGAIYRIVDANKVGYLSHPTVLIEADRNVVIERFGLVELVGFSSVKKNTIELYVKA